MPLVFFSKGSLAHVPLKNYSEECDMKIEKIKLDKKRLINKMFLFFVLLLLLMNGLIGNALIGCIFNAAWNTSDLKHENFSSSNGVIEELESESFNVVKKRDLWDGSIHSMHVNGNYLYVAKGFGGLETYDISYITEPILVSELDMDVAVLDVLVLQDLVYAVFDNSLLIVNITNPSDPEEVGKWSSTEHVFFQKILLYNSTAILLVSRTLIYLLDVSDPLQPEQLTNFNVEEVNDAAISGNHLYLASNDSIIVYDISSDSFNQVESYTFNGTVTRIEVSGELVHVIVNWESYYLVMMDFISPPNVLYSSQASQFNDLEDIVVKGDLVYLAGAPLLNVLNISDPNNAVFLGSLPSNEIGKRLVVLDNTTLISTLTEKLQVIDISSPSNMTVISEKHLSLRIKSAVFDGDLAWLAIEQEGVRLYNVSLVSLPIPTNVLINDFNEPVVELLLGNDLLYIALLGSGIRIYDVSNPLDPIFIGSYNCWITADTLLDLNGNVVYLVQPSETNSTLIIIKVLETGLIQELSTLDIPDTAKAMTRHDQYLFVLTSGGVVSIDTSNLEYPIIASRIIHDMGDPSAIAWWNGYLFISNPSKEMFYIGYATDPYDINGFIFIGAAIELDYPFHARQLFVNENGILFALNFNEIILIDLNTWRRGLPWPINTIDNGDEVKEVHVLGETLWALNLEGGINMYYLDDTQPPRIIFIESPAFKPLPLGSNFTVVVRILDISGLDGVYMFLNVNATRDVLMPMTQSSENNTIYYFKKGPINKPTKIMWYIQAMDNSSHYNSVYSDTFTTIIGNYSDETNDVTNNGPMFWISLDVWAMAPLIVPFGVIMEKRRERKTANSF